jgi:hypothetical protein
VGAEAQERDDLGAQTLLVGPVNPVRQERLEVDVREPVAQRCGHLAHLSTIFCAVTGGDDAPPFRQLVVANLAIQYQLVSGGSGHGRRSEVDLVEEHEAFRLGDGIGEEVRNVPQRAAVLDTGYTAQVDRVDL